MEPTYYIFINKGIDKEDVIHIHNGILLNHKKEKNHAICSNMDGPRECHTEWSKSDRGRQMSYGVTYVQSKNGTNEFIYKTEIESQMY